MTSNDKADELDIAEETAKLAANVAVLEDRIGRGDRALEGGPAASDHASQDERIAYLEGRVDELSRTLNALIAALAGSRTAPE
ncbi:hypothetical protein J2847_006456 [Azospirillum agricola]|uniref:hypothetical protein n=1 Tax=Azospirillum agricola TaxID=1720247 RepID=UPI001AE51D45|nr:hypothetical protein [Azospirillum agricola]MBP2233121.1 hypothetical protein [Azospirillum agricola]